MASVQQIQELRSAILGELQAGEWAGDIAERRRVKHEAVMALLMRPESVVLCRHCTASGTVSVQKGCAVEVKRCGECGGRGYAELSP